MSRMVLKVVGIVLRNVIKALALHKAHHGRDNGFRREPTSCAVLQSEDVSREMKCPDLAATSLVGACVYVQPLGSLGRCTQPVLILPKISAPLPYLKSLTLIRSEAALSSPREQGFWPPALLYIQTSHMRGERLRSCHVPRAKGDQTRKLIRVSMTKAEPG